DQHGLRQVDQRSRRAHLPGEPEAAFLSGCTGLASSAGLGPPRPLEQRRSSGGTRPCSNPEKRPVLRKSVLMDFRSPTTRPDHFGYAPLLWGVLRWSSAE